ncbi:MAG TPA: HEPN domain-containing protein, partial [Ramlibacter sp.]|nr:HEPN domain-containing protein [Ramlibacter sp.]
FASQHRQRRRSPVSNQMTPSALMTKAERACASARVLLDVGDVDGACNRAYYAMFDAARAALLASGAPVEPDIARTHGGLINAFSNHLVKNGPVSKEMGRLLNRAQRIRQIADYKGDSVELSDAQEMVEQAEIFVAAMRTEVQPRGG